MRLFLISFILLTISGHTLADEDPSKKFISFWKMQNSALTTSRINIFRKKCFPMGEVAAIDKKFCTQTGAAAQKLSTIISDLSGEAVSKSRALTCVDGIEEDFTDLPSLLKRLEAKDECDELNPGEFKLNHFLLERKANSNYLATVNVRFNLISGNKSPDDMLKVVNQCLRSVVPYLKTPDDKTLEIRVLSPEQVEASLPFERRPPENKINIVAGVEHKEGSEDVIFRDNAENFADSTPCSTFVHEFLHHLGLSDEYKETTKELAVPWACRVLPKTNTIMSHSQLFFSTVVPQKLECSCKTPECFALRKAVDSQKNENVKSLFLQPNVSKFLPQTVQNHCRPLVKDAIDRDPGQFYTPVSESPGKLLFVYRTLLLIKNKPVVMRVKMDCDCAEDKACEEGLKEFKLRTKSLVSQCPWITELTNTSFPSGLEESRMTETGLVIVTRPSSQRSLITPKQWGKILTGTCKSGPGGDYRTCEQFAYMSVEDPLCKVPPECNNDEFYLGVDEPEP